MSAERYVVFGLSRSGLAACEALRRARPQAAVIAGDDRRDVDADRLDRAGVEYRLGGEPLDMTGATALVKTPGAPRDHPVVREARRQGMPVWSEVELAYRLLGEPRIVGITGTNGKTTTTQLVGAMLREGGLEAEVAGNVGRPLSDLVGRVGRDVWIACELSSFQLEDIDTFHARVGVVLNVTPDHLDRHGTMDDYLRCKLRLLENQTAEDAAILNGDDERLRGADIPGGARRIWFSHRESDRIDWQHAGIRGRHNLENALAAALAAAEVGVPREARDQALRGFRPPPHRLELVAERRGVRFVNDSKATNPEAAMMALTAFDGGVRLILGGSLKGGSFAELAEAVADGPVVGVYLIGQAADAIAAELEPRSVGFERCGELAAAVARAAADAAPGDTVLLSPACASFDQFRDYEHRGAEFRRLAAEVPVGR